MRSLKFDETVKVPVSEIWSLFVQVENYPKYFKYVNKVFVKEEIKKNSVWYDFATFVAPVIIKHNTVEFEKEKKLGFDVSLPFGGYVKERIIFVEKDNITSLRGRVDYDFKVFRFLEGLFEKRMKESINFALKKLEQSKN